MSEMQIDTRELEDGLTVLALEGVLDKRSSKALETQMSDLAQAGKLKFVVDCAKLSHLSSDGMGVFLSFLIKIRKQGGDIKFCSMRTEVQTVLSVLGLSKLLVVRKNLDEAIADFTQAADPAPEKDTQKLRIEVEKAGEVSILSLYGFVDRHTIALLDEALSSSLEAGRANIVIDCAELTYISSNGMGVFISYVSKARSQGGDIRLCHLRDVARTVITMLGLHRHFEVFEERDEAIASYAS
jgi:anti-sigma B factor antagonist